MPGGGVGAVGGSLPAAQQIDLPPLAGDAAGLARQLAAMLAQRGRDGINWGVTGGETVVTLDTESGKGGRAQEMVLAFASEMYRLGSAAPRDWLVLVGGTDGRDGPTDAAGAMVGSADLVDADAAEAALARHDSYPYLAARGQLLPAMPTGTNLGDIAVFLAAEEE